MTVRHARLLSPEGLTILEMAIPAFQSTIEVYAPTPIHLLVDDTVPLSRRITYRYERTDGGGWLIYRQYLDLNKEDRR